MTKTMNRRALLADAAITTLATHGMRGLTHRAVDKAADLPEGSCSYYFRTRQALLQATIDRLGEVDNAEISALPAQGDLLEATAALIEHWTSEGRDRMMARYELALEATRRPELKQIFLEGGVRTRQLAEALLTTFGAADPPRQAPILVAYLDGLVFDNLAGAGALALSPAGLRQALAELFVSFKPS
jgi:DNA-binding transcriptional regulator YbjK